MNDEIVLLPTDLELPPILHGQATPQVEVRVRKFLFSVAAIYESWLGRRTSPHTRRSYDQDVMNFVRGYLGLRWPDDAAKILQVSIQTVQSYRDSLVAGNQKDGERFAFEFGLEPKVTKYKTEAKAGDGFKEAQDCVRAVKAAARKK